LESTGEWHELGLVECGPERFFRVARPEARGEVVASSMPATAQVTHLGRAVCVVQITALNASGKPCAIATVTTGPSGPRRPPAAAPCSPDGANMLLCAPQLTCPTP
jgi:hypothetical protein